MDAIEQRLRRLSAEFSPTRVTPPAVSLPRVLLRGRLYRAAFTALVAMGTSTAVLGAAVVVPKVIDPAPAPSVLIDSSDEEPLEIVEPDDKNLRAADEKPLDEKPLDKEPVEESVDESAKEPAPAPDKPVEEKASPAPKPAAADDKQVGDDGSTKDAKDDGTKKSDDKEEKADLTLTASQEKSKLTAAPYKNRYWGTATAGEKVKVFSDYGWGWTYADENGKWEVVVGFDPPVGTKTFTVTAKLWNHPEVSKSFSLTTVREAAEFTANQKEDVLGPPYQNGYWGTGSAGDTVWVWADEHGEATTTVGADGDWKVLLQMQDVEPGDKVDVKVRSAATGETIWFTVEITD